MYHIHEDSFAGIGRSPYFIPAKMSPMTSRLALTSLPVGRRNILLQPGNEVRLVW